jgi:uncharacterized membrane protein
MIKDEKTTDNAFIGKERLEELIQTIIGSDFDDLTKDIRIVMEKAKDPVFIGAMLYKLAKERELTNQILGKVYDKYEDILFEIKKSSINSQNQAQTSAEAPPVFNALSEQDKKILDIIAERNQVSAEEIQKALNYKGQNGASNRLNMLFKQGHLKKVRAGKKVYFMLI